MEHGTLGVQTHEPWVEASSLTTEALGSLLGLFGPKFFLFCPFSNYKPLFPFSVVSWPALFLNPACA